MAQILLATGIFYPDLGGPAIHVRKIAEAATTAGFQVTVLAYGDDPSNKEFPFRVIRVSRSLPKILQWLQYVAILFREGWRSRLMYAFDPSAAGIPTSVVAKMLGKPFIIRIGGDPIWEREVEEGRRFMSMDQYYDAGLYKRDRPVLYRLIRMMLRYAQVLVVYNQNFKDFYSTYYGMPKEKIRIVKNPVFVREKARTTRGEDPMVLFAGRFVAYKNLPLVMRAFDAVREKIGTGELILIGKGPDKEVLLQVRNNLRHKNHITFKEAVPQEILFDLIRDSAVCIGPALSEFNPNFILESLSFGKPVLLSKGHGLSVELSEKFLFDPFDQKELEMKMLYLFDPTRYTEAVAEIAALPINQTWENVQNFHTALIKEHIV